MSSARQIAFWLGLSAVELAAAAHAAPGNWDHRQNIKEAAERLVKLHRREGSTGVLKFLDACYKTHLLAEKFTKGLEACMAQDYVHTKVLASIYAKLPEAELKKRGAPTATVIAKDMNARFVTSFMQYKVTVADAEDFKRIVEEVGMPIFVEGVFPGSKERNAPADKPPAGKNPR